MTNFKRQLGDRFKTKDMVVVYYLLKINVEKTRDGGWKIHR